MELVRSVSVSGSISGLAANGGDRGKRDVFHVSFDPETESIEVVVVESVAAIQNRAPEELDPLYEAVDPEALDDLVAPEAGEQARVDEVGFVYEGLEVTIESDGDVWIRWL